MRRLMALFLIFFLCFSPAHALRVAPYLGAALQYQMIAFSGGSHRADSFQDVGPFISVASEYEVGVTSPSYTLYAAYHFYPVTGTEMWGNMLSWRESRFLLGGRWHLNAECRSWAQATLGLGLSYGRIHIIGDYYSVEVRGSRSYSNWSESSLGGMAEMGLLIHTGTAVDIDVLSRIEAYDASFIGNKENNFSVKYHLISPSLHVGARYVFPSIKIGG